jgi:hypothetical protein
LHGRRNDVPHRTQFHHGHIGVPVGNRPRIEVAKAAGGTEACMTRLTAVGRPPRCAILRFLL